MTRILHISDTHGDLDVFNAACEEKVDIVVHSGDFFPDYWNEEYDCWDKYIQRGWLKANSNNIAFALEGRPFIFVQGNHDWTDMSNLDYNELHELDQSSVIVNDLKFYGFPNVPNLTGWSHYTDSEDFIKVLKKVENDTNVLVPHCPPRGILDGGMGIVGIRERIDQLSNIKLVLFGHIHECKGVKVVDGVIYSNAACGWNVIEL